MAIMNRELRAPISRSARSGRATPRRAGARRSCSCRAVAHVLDSRAGQELADLVSGKLVQNRHREGIADIQLPIAGPELVIDPAVELGHRTIHHHSHLTVMKDDQADLRNSGDTSDEHLL